MIRYLSLVALLIAAAQVRGSDDGLGKFGVVSIYPATASFYIVKVSMAFQPFVRRRSEYSSTYSAKVFPYFFWSEKGRIWIVIPDDDLRRVALGQAVDFKGHALSESGDKRTVEGRATPTGPASGRIRVKVIISKRIILTYDTTYELVGPPAPTGGHSQENSMIFSTEGARL